MSIGSAAGLRIRRSLASWVWVWVWVVAALLTAGCEEKEGIQVYKIPKQIPEQLRPSKDRMLVVMAPRGEQAWFFKLQGPEKVIGDVETQFKEFVFGITFNSEDEPVLETLPDNWRRGRERPMRFATLDINTPNKQLELSISSLPLPLKPGETASEMSEPLWEQYVRSNVKRWRGQLGLSDDQTEWGGAAAEDITWAERQAVLLDIVGTAGSGGMGGMPPMMGQSGSMPPMTRPPSMPSQTSRADAPPTSSAVKLDGEPPKGWRQLPAGGFRLMAFEAGPKESPAVTTVSKVGGEVRANVARWLGQVEESSPAPDAVDELMANGINVEVSGQPGTRFIIQSENESSKTAIDGTVVPLEDGRSMFIKMTGPPKVVAQEKEAVAEFLRTLAF
ncbi:MAG: hypothetical protein AAFV88_23780 [Planctomycetota bacterium]